MIIPNEILDGVSSTPTSTFPYQSVGPIDFQNLNLVKTTQVDYYYGTIGTSGTEMLLSTVTQEYDPSTAILIIGGMILTFFLILGWGIYRIKKMGK